MLPLTLGCGRETQKVVSARYINIISVYICTCMHACIHLGSKACEKLYDIICNNKLLVDVQKLSPQQQTSSLESYHSVVNHFAPKLLAFSYIGMHCRYMIISIIIHIKLYQINLHRLIIAAMHFNENFGRQQAITKSGKERIRIVFPKQKQGEYTPKIVPVPPTFSNIYL